MPDPANNQKSFFGLPKDWDFKRPLGNLWSKETDKIILPKSFGIGWTINLHALFRQMGWVKR